MDLTKLPKNLPLPDEAMLAHSQRVSAYLQNVIDQAGGGIPFEQFMQLALYAPGLGYYSAGARKFGEAGDFVTAPEISPLFSHCLALNIQQVLNTIEGASILEIGAGSGAMACDILHILEQQGTLPEYYYILELSADLKARQQACIEASLPHLMEKIQWLEQLPESGFRGVVVGNEVVDAMPVHLFRMEQAQRISEVYVEWQNDVFAYSYREINNGVLFEAIEELKENLDPDTLYPGYVSEVNLQSRAWMKSLASMLERGVLLLIDYGFPSREYYHHDRSMGTLMCHYRHHSHENPLLLVGLQDITAHVDFSSLAASAQNAGMDLIGYTSQANFLLASGLDNVVAQSDPNDIKRHLALVQQVKKLVMPNEMGELFKAIGWAKNYSGNLLGFSQQNMCDRL